MHLLARNRCDARRLWSIPVDQERDFDCILEDAISELVQLRDLLGPGRPVTTTGQPETAARDGLRQRAERLVEMLNCRRFDAHYCPNCDNSLFEARELARDLLARLPGPQGIRELQAPSPPARSGGGR